MSLGLDSLGTASLGLGGELPRTEYGFLLFDFEPNQAGFMQEVLTWQTQVLEAQDGTEQRQGFRARPRRQFVYSTTQEGQRAFNLENLIYGSNQQKFAMPVWTDGATLTAPINDSVELAIDYTNRGFWAGGYILIYQSQTQYEFARIASFDVGFVLLTETTFYAWPAGARVYPVVFAKAAMPTNLAWFTGNVLTADLTLEVLPTESNDHLPIETAPSTYLGLEVLTSRPNWDADMGNDVRADYLAVDSGVGLFDRFYQKKHARFGRGFKWWLNGKADITAFRAFLQRRKGQLVPFWLPRHYRELQLVSNVGALDVDIVTTGTHHVFYTGAAKGREHIAITLRNGTVFYRQVTALSALSGNAVLTLNANLGQAITPDDVESVAWLIKSRLAADQVTIPWHDQEFADPDTTFVSLL